MRAKNNISALKHTIGIAIGIIAALVILVSQTFYFDYLANTDGDKVKTEVAEDGSEHHASDVLTISQDAVTTVVQFTINQILLFITDLQLISNEDVKVEFSQKVELTTYFKTLFRLIISPNAP